MLECRSWPWRSERLPKPFQPNEEAVLIEKAATEPHIQLESLIYWLFFASFFFFSFSYTSFILACSQAEVEIILEKTSLQFWAVSLFPTEKTDWTRRLGVLNLLVLRGFLSAYVLSRPYFSTIQGSRGVEVIEGEFLAQFAA